MGQRQNQTEIVYGNDCWRGINLTKPLWLEGQTPKYIYLRFSEIQKCIKEICDDCPSPANDRVFKLTQSEYDPCYWDYFGDWEVHWWLQPGIPTTVRFVLFWPTLNKHYFYADFITDGDNARFAANEITCEPFGHCGYNGIAVASWRLESLDLLKSLNIKPAYDLFMEMRPLVDGNKVYKYCKLKDGTNIAIEFESD